MSSLQAQKQAVTQPPRSCAMPRFPRPGKRVFVCALLIAAWIILLLVTHAGPRSPYTYAAFLIGVGPDGRVANFDAGSVHGVTRFFYDGTPPDYLRAHNLWLPLHSFAVAVAGSFLRNYLVANYVVNALFFVLVTIAALRLATRLGIRAEAMLIALRSR